MCHQCREHLYVWYDVDVLWVFIIINNISINYQIITKWLWYFYSYDVSIIRSDILIARPQFVHYPTPRKKYCSPDPSPNFGILIRSEWILYSLNEFVTMHKIGPRILMENISYWGHNIDLKYSSGRANSIFWEGSDKVQFGVGRKVGPDILRINVNLDRGMHPCLQPRKL